MRAKVESFQRLMAKIGQRKEFGAFTAVLRFPPKQGLDGAPHKAVN